MVLSHNQLGKFNHFKTKLFFGHHKHSDASEKSKGLYFAGTLSRFRGSFTKESILSVENLSIKSFLTKN